MSVGGKMTNDDEKNEFGREILVSCSQPQIFLLFLVWLLLVPVVRYGYCFLFHHQKREGKGKTRDSSPWLQVCVSCLLSIHGCCLFCCREDKVQAYPFTVIAFQNHPFSPCVLMTSWMVFPFSPFKKLISFLLVIQLCIVSNRSDLLFNNRQDCDKIWGKLIFHFRRWLLLVMPLKDEDDVIMTSSFTYDLGRKTTTEVVFYPSHVCLCFSPERGDQ